MADYKNYFQLDFENYSKVDLESYSKVDLNSYSKVDLKDCWNIGMHYLRKVNEDSESLDRIMERGFGVSGKEGGRIEEMFEVMEENVNEEEKYEKLEKVWGKLKEVDRMILESYYVDGCKMEEIAKKVGYKNGNSVKSRKKKVLMRIKKMIDGVDSKNLPAAA